MIKYCKYCDRYSMKEECPECGRKTISPHPARFSPKDPYGEYRRKLKVIEWKRG